MKFTDLPSDFESEILSRVPATSLHQLRSTCKRWYALFKDLNFIKKNLSKTASQQVILKKNNRVYSVNGIDHTFDPSIEVTAKLNCLNDDDDVKITEIFHCDGLFLCSMLGDSRLVVWNPCTGKTRWIQPSNRNKAIKYALGYEKKNNKSCNSYKILKSSKDPRRCVIEFEIYEFDSESWRLLEDVTENWYIQSHGVSLKGNTNWVASDKEVSYTRIFLLRFDFTRERFEVLSLPYEGTYYQNMLLSVVREEKLSLLLEMVYMDSSKMMIWVTDTKIDEVKDTKIRYFLVARFGILMIPGITPIKSFLVDEEKKMVLCSRKEKANKERTVIYTVGENTHVCKQVHGDITNEQEDYWPLLLSYVPSLVHIQQASTSGNKRKR